MGLDILRIRGMISNISSISQDSMDSRGTRIRMGNLDSMDNRTRTVISNSNLDQDTINSSNSSSSSRRGARIRVCRIFFSGVRFWFWLLMDYV
jgi:hypothetical protein